MPVLVDTSVWIAHLQAPSREMVRLLESDEVVMCSTVLGELAVGNLHRRTETLNALLSLLQVPECPFARSSNT